MLNFTYMFYSYFKSNFIITILAILSFSSVKSQTTYNPVTPALGFNVFTQQNLKAKGGDTQGPVAIGGDLVLEGQTVFAMNTTGYFPTNSLNNVNNFGIVIDGKISYTSGNSSFVNNGFLRLKNTIGSTIYYVDNNNTPSNLRVTPGAYGSNPQISLQRQQTVNTATNASGINFASAFTQFNTNANKISTLSSGSCPNMVNEIFVPSGQNPSITLVSDKINIINLSATQLTNLTNLTFTNTPAANRIIIFNVSASGSYNWATIPNFGGINEQNSSFILWNFYNLTSLNLSGSNTIYGTLFAPMADIIKSSTNNANGQVISKSFEMGLGEVHYYPFEGFLPDCPTGSPLALSKIDLSAILSGKNANINFYILQEEIGDVYEIQRSFDGSNFTTFKRILQDNIQNGKYSLVDNIADYNTKTIYYRVKVVNNSGFVYSNIKSLKLSGDDFLKIWPVPMGEVLNVSYQSDLNTQGVLQVIDTKGQIIYNKTCSLLKGNNFFLLNTFNTIIKGNYTFKIITANGNNAAKHFTKL